MRLEAITMIHAEMRVALTSTVAFVGNNRQWDSMPDLISRAKSGIKADFKVLL